MSVDDHGLEVLRKSGRQVIQGIKNEYEVRTFNPVLEAFQFIIKLMSSIIYDSVFKEETENGIFIHFYNAGISVSAFKILPHSTGWTVTEFSGYIEQENGYLLMTENGEFLLEE